MTPDEKLALHRAAIRTTIINASLDMTDMHWTADEDKLLDTIDDWLGDKTIQAQALVNAKPAEVDFAMGAGKAKVAINPPRMPPAKTEGGKFEHDFSNPLTGGDPLSKAL